MRTTAIDTDPNSLETGNALAKEIATYLALTFGISWVLWIGAIKLGLGELESFGFPGRGCCAGPSSACITCGEILAHGRFAAVLFC